MTTKPRGSDLRQGAVGAGASVVRAARDVVDRAVKRVRGNDHDRAIPSSEATHERSAREEGCPPVILTANQTKQLNQIERAAKRTSDKARKAARS
jgi:hypothetical protein